MNELRFEWDENKNIINQKKHEGVTFEEAETVFTDIHARLILDPEHSEGEERFILMGMSSKFRILLVCHCERDNGNIIRIISAQKADRSERKQYEDFCYA